jgi:CheY-like chemotaxis protein
LPAPGRLRLCVEDTGPGIPLDRQQELFEPFNRLGAEMGPVEGTGIGLVITKRLTEMMGGRIGLDSRPGQGSTFWVEFDRIQATPAAAAGPQTRPGNAAVAARHSGSLFYVEDNAVNVRLVEKAIASRRPELAVQVANSGEAALAHLARHRPDAILLDIGLPDMDGFQLLERIRGLDNLKGVPVIALTASATSDDIARGAGAGFDAYLTKPLHIEQLIRTLDEFIQPDRT